LPRQRRGAVPWPVDHRPDRRHQYPVDAVPDNGADCLRAANRLLVLRRFAAHGDRGPDLPGQRLGDPGGQPTQRQPDRLPVQHVRPGLLGNIPGAALCFAIWDELCQHATTQTSVQVVGSTISSADGNCSATVADNATATALGTQITQYLTAAAN